VKRLAIAAVAAGLILAGTLAWAGGPKGTTVFVSSPPRFQIFKAKGPYGGLILLDTRTGTTYQRVVVNTGQGIEIRWLKLKKVEEVKPPETILWNP